MEEVSSLFVHGSEWPDTLADLKEKNKKTTTKTVLIITHFKCSTCALDLDR